MFEYHKLCYYVRNLFYSAEGVPYAVTTRGLTFACYGDADSIDPFFTEELGITVMIVLL